MMKLRTQLSADECRKRLASGTDLGGLSLSWNTPAAGPKVLGDFRGAAFRLHTGRYYTNSFAPFFYGKLSASENGTLIEGGFQMHPFARMFAVFWFSFVAVFAAAGFIVPMGKEPGRSVGRGTLFLALGSFVVAGVGLIKFGQWLGRGEQKTILDFLKTSLEATEV